MPKRILEGRVVSDKANKTVSVLVERRTLHPIYKKYMKKSRKYSVHDENNMFRMGDVVRIQETNKMSKSKAFTVISDVPAGREPRTFKQAEVAATPAKKPVAKATPKKDTKEAAPKAEAKKVPAKKSVTKKTTAKKASPSKETSK